MRGGVMVTIILVTRVGKVDRASERGTRKARIDLLRRCVQTWMDRVHVGPERRVIRMGRVATCPPVHSHAACRTCAGHALQRVRALPVNVCRRLSQGAPTRSGVGGSGKPGPARRGYHPTVPEIFIPMDQGLMMHKGSSSITRLGVAHAGPSPSDTGSSKAARREPMSGFTLPWPTGNVPLLDNAASAKRNTGCCPVS